MTIKNIILLIMLLMAFSLAIGGVSAVKSIGPCPSGDENHKTTWEKKFARLEFDNFVKKNGKYYKRYNNIYRHSVIGCDHKSHLKLNTYNYPYRYDHYGPDSDKPYVYKLAKQKTTKKIYFKVKSVFDKKTGTSGIPYVYKRLKKSDDICVYYSGNKDGQWLKHTLFINLGYINAEGPDDNIARNHLLTKASVKFVKNSNKKISITKTYLPHKKWKHIARKTIKGYTPKWTKITYVY